MKVHITKFDDLCQNAYQLMAEWKQINKLTTKSVVEMQTTNQCIQ